MSTSNHSDPAPVPILMYHRIADEASALMRRFTVTPREFDAQLALLRRGGFTPLTVSDWVSRCAPGGADQPAMPARPVVLTFDDGFTDFEQHALPLLRRHDAVATLYVVAGRVGQRSGWLPGRDADLALLDWNALARLQHAGIEIGSHGLTHRALDGLSEPDIARELTESRRLIGEQLGQMPDSVCYPFGFRDARVRRLARQAGYTSGCAVRYACATPQDDRYDIPRHIVPGGLPPADFDALLHGHPPPLALWRNRARSHAGQLARQLYHSALRP